MAANAHHLFGQDRIRDIFQSFKPTPLAGGSDLKPSGVLIPIAFDHANSSVVLTVRTSRVRDHKGEISFPGGRKDPEDASFEATALRESHEEVGILPDHVEIIGQIDDIQTRSGYLVRPFVGFIPPDYAFQPSEQEVDLVLDIPLTHLLNGSHTTHEWRTNANGLEHNPVYHYDGHAVWGATARILDQFLGLLNG